MKSQAENESKFMDYRQKQKQQILAQVPASQECTSSLEKQWSCHEPGNWKGASTDCSNQLEFKASRSKKVK